MRADEFERLSALAEQSFDRAAGSARRTSVAIARADDVLARTGRRDSVSWLAAKRERQRLNAGLGRIALRIAIAVAAIWIATVVIGLVQPIGLFGLIGAVLLGLAISGAIALFSRGSARPALPSPDLPPAALIDRFDSYLYRSRAALPAPAQAEVDQMLSALPTLRQTLERTDPGDPTAQEAKRLVGTHLPSLIDRYLAVPSEFRAKDDGDGVTVDRRLTDALHAGAQAIDDVRERLARGDVAAFETQGRFIESRYGEDPLDR